MNRNGCFSDFFFAWFDGSKLDGAFFLRSAVYFCLVSLYTEMYFSLVARVSWKQLQDIRTHFFAIKTIIYTFYITWRCVFKSGYSARWRRLGPTARRLHYYYYYYYYYYHYHYYHHRLIVPCHRPFPPGTSWLNIISYNGLGVACWPLVPKFGFKPGRSRRIFKGEKSSARLPSEGK